jgi:hypothetical protein
VDRSRMSTCGIPASGRLRRLDRRPVLAALVGMGLALGGCDVFSRPVAHAAPAAEEVRPHFTYEGDLSVEMSGNVAQVTVVVDPAPYRRGGDLWAKATPYLFLFSTSTRDAFEANPGLGGVRVIIQHPNGDWMAQALLSREVLTETGWRQALNLSGLARRDGTERPGRMQDLVRWGEDRTEFQYNPGYISER